MKRNKKEVGIIGYGTMGSCLGCALADNGWRVFVYDKDATRHEPRKNVSFCKTPDELIERASVIIIAVKPQDVKALLDICEHMLSAKKHLVISIAAGVSTAFFEKKIKEGRIVRVMPNLAANKRLSMTFIAGGKYCTSRDRQAAGEIFNCVGVTEFIRERFLDKVTALTGSGPGYVFYFMECFYKSARALGFDKKTARKMIRHTFWGALNIIKDSDDEFALWIKRVASKGGTTQAALNVWSEANCDKLIQRAVCAAAKRAKELNLK